MSISAETRPSDSPYVEAIMHGWTTSAGISPRPSEVHWHMVFVRTRGQFHPLVVGPLTTAGIASWGDEAEILWIKFKLGTFMPHLPAKNFLDVETRLPEAAGQTFWLKGAAWELPTFENADTFVTRLVRENVLERDPVVKAALHDQLKPEAIAARTVRHRFLRSTGLTQAHIRQFERAQQAAALLEQGVSILDTVYELGYFDQPHLTKALKRFLGKTPAQQLARLESA
ncbi:MAG: helix-turn-helix domain-containing protein [Chloroflexi bacterium]|nr:helix-turn-helix domain-containing protein [Chloroflexota bacterium]